MGKVLSIANPFRNFNIESRAHKVISQAKPVVAPKHKSDQLQYEKLLKDNPAGLQETLQRNPELDKHLKDVFVISSQDNPKIPHDPSRPLPAHRGLVGQAEFGFEDPKHVPMGKVSLRKALQFITNHQAEPVMYNAKKISEEYSLPEETVKNILTYFRVFEVYVPVERRTNAKFAGPSLPKTTVIKNVRKQIAAPIDSTKEKT